MQRVGKGLSIRPQKEGKDVKKLVFALVFAALLLLVFPGNSSLRGTPSKIDNVGTPQEPEIKVSESIYASCPGLTKLPLMLGRPAPCVESYKIDMR